MDFRLVSKNYIGIVGTLILVILLSQSRFFDFLTETSLGRIILLLFTIFISYTNKFLGLLAVLFIIIAFNNNDMNYGFYGGSFYGGSFYEGFDGSGNILNNSGNSLETAVSPDKANISQNKQNISVNLQQKTQQLQQQQQQQQQQQINNSSQTAAATSSAASTTSPPSSGTEGFCILDKENNMLRGKQSNSVPVFNNSRQQDDNVSPSDKSIFSDSYSTF